MEIRKDVEVLGKIAQCYELADVVLAGFVLEAMAEQDEIVEE
jgi:hypothetical protein